MNTALDRVVIGALILSVSLGLLALLAIYASMPSPHRAVSPPPNRPGTHYRCHCWDRPIRVLIVDPPDPQSQTTSRARHAKPHQDHRARPNASHAGAGGGGRGAPPVHAVA